MAAIAIVNTAFLLNAQPMAELSIPILYLAEKNLPPSGRRLFHYFDSWYFLLLLLHDVDGMQPLLFL